MAEKPVFRKRTRSEWLRNKWLEDYAVGLKKGTKEWEVDRNIENENIKNIDLSTLNLNTNECILILPCRKDEKETTMTKSTSASTSTSASASKSNIEPVEEHKSSSGDGNRDHTVPSKEEVEWKMFRLPVLYPTIGNACVDVRQLYDKTYFTTYDPGYMSTASCHSQITYIDGGKGILLHRGYAIEDLCEHCDFVELSFLLMYGELPNTTDYDDHLQQIHKHMVVHEKLIEFYKGFRYDAHPMAIMCAVVGALSSFYHDTLDITNPDDRLQCAYRLIAKMPTLAALAYKTSIGEPIMYPKSKYSYAENFLYMMFATPTEEYKVHPAVVKALDKFLMLHADHEQNASTATVRIAGSSHANPYACIASGITALWGPAHGGANEACLNMLEEIGTKDRIPQYIARAKDKTDSFRLMGFGHRVYKNYDPRAKVMQKMCHEILDALDMKDEPLFELAMELEKIALNDEYFVKRKLYPNVDFYSGIVLKAMGIPKTMFTVLFAVARCIGWISQWKEMISDPKQRIGRPRQLYVGSQPRTILSRQRRKSINIEQISSATKLE